MRRMIVEFGQNVARRLHDPSLAGEPVEQAGFSPLRMFFAIIRDRLRRLVSRH